MLIFKRVLFALISVLTLYIGNVYNLSVKRGLVRPPRPPFPTPMNTHNKRLPTFRCLFAKTTEPCVVGVAAVGGGHEWLT